MAERKSTKKVETAEVETPVVETPVVEPTENKAPITPFANDKKPKIPVPGILVGVAVIAIVILLGLLISGGGKKNVFKKTIKDAYKDVVKEAKEADKTLKEFNVKENAIYFSGDIKVELKEDGEKQSMKGSVVSAISAKDEQAYAKVTINGEDTDLTIEGLIDEGVAYLESSLFDETIALDDAFEKEDLEMVFETLKNASQQKATDYTEIGQYVVDALVKNLDKDQIEVDDEKLEIGDKEVKVTKVSYDLSGDALSDLMVGVIKDLLDNDKFIDKTVKLVKDTVPDVDFSKSDFKDALKELKDSVKDQEIDEKLAINIYTKGMLNKVVGYSVSIKGKNYAIIYNDDKNFLAEIDDHGESYRTHYRVTAEKEKKEWSFTVRDVENKNTLATGTVRELSDEKIDFDVKVPMEDEEDLKVSVLFTSKHKKRNISGEFDIKVSQDDNAFNVSGTYAFESKDEIDEDVKTSKAVSIDDIDIDALEENIEKLKDDEIIDSIFGDTLDDLLSSTANYNYYDMREVESESDAKSVLKKNKAVLYIGDTYYSSYYEQDAYNMFKYLRELQTELGFHSYMLRDYYTDDEFVEELIKGVDSTCAIEKPVVVTPSDDKKDDEKDTDDTNSEIEEKDDNTTIIAPQDPTPTTPTSKCDTTPVIIIVKDGKAIKAIQGKVTKDDIKKELAKIDIE